MPARRVSPGDVAVRAAVTCLLYQRGIVLEPGWLEVPLIRRRRLRPEVIRPAEPEAANLVVDSARSRPVRVQTPAPVRTPSAARECGLAPGLALGRRSRLPQLQLAAA